MKLLTFLQRSPMLHLRRLMPACIAYLTIVGASLAAAAAVVTESAPLIIAVI